MVTAEPAVVAMVADVVMVAIQLLAVVVVAPSSPSWSCRLRRRRRIGNFLGDVGADDDTANG